MATPLMSVTGVEGKIFLPIKTRHDSNRIKKTFSRKVFELAAEV
jgi:hypothetical protein